MKRLFVCCDGTWNSPTDLHDGVPVPTNVTRFRNALAESDSLGNLQVIYYHSGVGTDGGWFKRIWEGATGGGLSANVQSAYKWLCDNYQPGDLIYLLGFSRGAFTARSLGGLINRCGLPQRIAWSTVRDAYDVYRIKPEAANEKKAAADFRSKYACDPPPSIHFIGVWDTVGALGIPRDVNPLGFQFSDKRFHDTTLSSIVKNAFHVLAIDEMRANFAPTLWTGNPAPGQTVEQVWFPGVHADVGGGYQEAGLSNAALMWMIEKARFTGAKFRDELVHQIVPNTIGVLHDSYKGVFSLTRSEPRPFPEISPSGHKPTGQSIHASALERQSVPPIEQTPYRSTRHLAPGESIEVSIPARDFWAWTGIYMSKDEVYEFKATGYWQDAGYNSGPNGMTGGLIHRLAYLLKRIREYPWFSLIGAIGDSGNPDTEGVPEPLPTFLIGSNLQWHVTRDGYLYCFANDAVSLFGDKAWFYRNNHGSINLKVSRVT